MNQAQGGPGMAERPIETASATTSPDNSNSGPFAYIVFGITLAVLMLTGFGVSSCSSIIVNEALQSSGNDWGFESQRYEYDLDDIDWREYGLDEDLMHLLENEGLPSTRTLG